eukprot:scaffold287075_cov14-Tisochrysis_lutea.AAC.1
MAPGAGEEPEGDGPRDEEEPQEWPPSNPEPSSRPRSSMTPGVYKAKKRRRSYCALTPKEAPASRRKRKAPSQLDFGSPG